MRMHREELALRTAGENDVIDITEEVRAIIDRAGVADGTVHVFTPGATAGVTAIEFEPGCVADLKAAFHNRRWGDGNGFSHVRAAMLGPSLSVPLAGGRLLLGTWQQIVVVDFDNGARDRRVVVTVT
jgi:secondary thiamine-phosphate synthase enzyme